VIAILFAVHPVHVENVAWISGVPDTLVGFFLLGSLILAQSYVADSAGPGARRSVRFLLLSILSFVLALGAKETALLCAPLFWFVLKREGGEAGSKLGYGSGYETALYLIAAAAFFIARFAVLGSVFIPVEDPVPGNSFLNIPNIFAFYLRQVLFPLWLGPALPVRPVDTVGITTFVLPLVISCAVIGGLWILARRSRVQMFGLALFVLTLLPVINPSNFSTEHLVHDRYLYLPLAGILIVVVPALTRFIGSKSRTIFLTFFSILILALGVKTYSYSSVWRSDETLWRYAVVIDPNSAHAWFNLAAAASDPRDSLGAYERSLAIKRTGGGLAGKSRALIALGDFEGAAATAREAISIDPNQISAYTLFQAYEVESLALFNLGRYSEGEEELREARPRLPIYYGALTEKLAVMLYVQNRKGEALAELEGARIQARQELLPASKQLFLRLGQLYAELGRKEDAKTALEEYLASTSTATDKSTIDDRRQATELLGKMVIR
jgi:tetratricopeptide (TPR) repeat protein